MEITDFKQIKDKNLIVFDLDGTLAPTKSSIDKEMGKLVENLLKIKKMAVIGGGKFELFEEQFLNNLAIPETLLKKLSLFPTTATTFYLYDKGWKKVYAHNLTADEVERIMSAFKKVYDQIGYQDPKKNLRQGNRKSRQSGNLVSIGSRCSQDFRRKRHRTEK